jgi:hypothetical protein
MTVYDCFTYSGEIDVLKLRLEVLDPVVDIFVVVEPLVAAIDGAATSALREQWAQVRPWARKLRHVIEVVPAEAEPERGGSKKVSPTVMDSSGRALADLADDDVVLFSDVTDIPSPAAVRAMEEAVGVELAQFEVRESVLMLNYASTAVVSGGIVVRGSSLADHKPSHLISKPSRRKPKLATLQQQTLQHDVGWRFTHIGDVEWIESILRDHARRRLFRRRKPSSTNPVEEITNGRDLLRRNSAAWGVVTPEDLPHPVRSNPEAYRDLLLTDGTALRDQLEALRRGHEHSVLPNADTNRPIIICPYLHDEDEPRVREAFGLSEERGQRLPFFIWQDTERIGPERAFEHCWNQFPDRDVIIVHPDMYPMPNDPDSTWYERLIEAVRTLPDAGVVGCDLIFPEPTPTGGLAAQCVGGRIKQARIKHVGGRAHEYDDRYRGIRRSDWATFGGVYIRREAIDMCGSFDDRYEWAYVMDVDYCMEVQLRGLRTYQVPVNLVHEENGTTKEFLANPVFKAKFKANQERFVAKWRPYFRGRCQRPEDRTSHETLPLFPGG